MVDECEMGERDVFGQQGRLAVVTRANTGLGFETAQAIQS
jgi:hypothetical protein